MATPRRLYKGQLPAASTALYTCPAGKSALIKGIRIINTDATARWARLGTDGTADTDLIVPQWPVDPAGMETDADLVVLEAGQSIYGRAEVAAKLTCHIFGMEL